MKVHLAYPDRDLDLGAPPPANAETLIDDLGLELVFAAMAAGDRDLDKVARSGVLIGLETTDQILYRQGVLRDCLAHPALVRELYAIAVEALKEERSFWIYTEQYPESLLRRAVALMGRYVTQLRRLRNLAQEHRAAVGSDGLRRLFAELVDELDEGYLHSVEETLRPLQFRDGVVLSATLGPTNLDTEYVLRRRAGPRTWRDWIGMKEADSLSWEVPPRDEGGAQALEALRRRGIALAAAALGQSADHITSYFSQLRAELGFYLACLNLHDTLTAKGEPTCIPEVAPTGERALSARGLYDAALSLALGQSRAVGNDLEADGKPLIVITGPNRGGKSTLLRSLGLAQLMMQAGMFVPADAFAADIRRGLFTHFRREEDAKLRSGKLDEELGRMDGIVDEVTPESFLMLNESFASTNEREGSEIGRQVVRALLRAGIKVAYVTHMFHLAQGLREEHHAEAVFLRAERLPDGRRTFRVIPGEPLPTSHGQDIYRAIFTEPGGTGARPDTEVRPT